MGSSIVMVAWRRSSRKRRRRRRRPRRSRRRPRRQPRSSRTRSGSCGTADTPRPRKPLTAIEAEAKKEPAGLTPALKVALRSEQGRVSGQSG